VLCVGLWRGSGRIGSDDRPGATPVTGAHVPSPSVGHIPVPRKPADGRAPGWQQVSPATETRPEPLRDTMAPGGCGRGRPRSRPLAGADSAPARREHCVFG
jgi:hypothetical protein